MQLEIGSVWIIERKSSSFIYLEGEVNGSKKVWSTGKKKNPVNRAYIEDNKTDIFKRLAEEKLGVSVNHNSLLNFGLRFIEEIKKEHEEDTNVEHINRLRNYIIPFFEDSDVRDITTEEVKYWQNSLFDDDTVSNDKVKRVRITFKMIMSAAASEFKFENPFSGVRVPKIKEEMATKEDGLVEYYDLDSIKTILAACKDKELLLYIYIAVFTGMRENEIIALRKSSISLEKGAIKVDLAVKRGKLGNPKDEEIRSVPLLAPLLNYLHKIDFFSYPAAEADNFIFTSPGKQKKSTAGINKNIKAERESDRAIDERIKNQGMHYYSVRSLRKRFIELLKQDDVDINYIGFYELKHSFATNMLELGWKINVISKVLGHSTIDTTIRHYIKQRKYEDIDIDKANDYFDKIL